MDNEVIQSEAEKAAQAAEAEKVAQAAEAEKIVNEAKALMKDAVDHEHRWRRGILSGGRYVKTCFVDGCGVIKDIAFEEWQTISDR